MTLSPERIEVEGDKPLVERTRHYFSALIAALKTGQEYAGEIDREIDRLRAELAEERGWKEFFRGQAGNYGNLQSDLAVAVEALELIAAKRRNVGFDPWAVGIAREALDRIRGET